MAHWIIDDRGFGGVFYTCSNCKAVFSTISKDDPGMWDFCKECGQPLDEDKVYTDDDISVNKKEKTMKKPHKTTLFDRLKDALNAFNRKPFETLRLGMEVKRCDECEYKNPRLIELNSFSVGGNIYHKDEGCRLALWYEDEAGYTMNDASIRLSQKKIRKLIEMLEYYLEEEL